MSCPLRNKLGAWFVLGLALVVAGCLPDSPLTPAEHLGEARAVRSQGSPASGARLTIDDEYARIADEVPGFAGIYFDGSGVPVVLLKNSQAASEARGRLSELLLRGANGNAAQVAQVAGQMASLRVEHARFDFRELYDWYKDMVISAAFAVSGVVMTDIDERRNRIVVGVRDGASLGRARASMAALGLPRDAYDVAEYDVAGLEMPASTQHVEDCDPMTAIIECPEPPSGASGDTTSLRATRRPIIGGLQIQYSEGFSAFNCSLGYNIVHRDAVGTLSANRYFVTNSHCGAIGQMTGMSMGQSTAFENVSNELADPPFFSAGTDAMCPPGRLCRYSDASLFQYYSPTLGAHGRVAFPNLGQLNVGLQREVVAGGDPVVGMVVHRIGRTTGRSVGTVDQTCANFVVYDEGFDTGRMFLCQSRATYASASGDSGGPVVEVLSDGTLVARGIHWRGNGGFSPMNAVLAELRAVTGGGLGPTIHDATP